jgi:hypothetical protein
VTAAADGVASLVLGLVVIVGLVVVLRGIPPAGPASPIVLTAGAEQASTEQLTATAADILATALTTGAGIEFEIVQTSTIVARKDGPLVEIPDPADRTKSLGSAPLYVMGTLVERGFATPDGYWMELIHGPEPGAESEFDVAKGHVSRQALVREGRQYRNDGHGWHETDQLPGIGLDPATLAKLPGLVSASASGTDVALDNPAPIDPAAGRAAELGPETVAIDPGRVAVTMTGLRGPHAPPVRALAATTTVTALPGIIAVDLADATELLGPARLGFDGTGRLVSLTISARNTNLEIHDLVIDTLITIRYPDRAAELPRPEPAYVEPTPDPDGETER